MYEPHYGCVAFRLDDVQDFYLSDTQIAIIDLFRGQSAKLTIGIIANAFGKDSVLVDYIKDMVKPKGKSAVRIANHGWNHENMTRLNKKEQANLIKQSNQKIFQILNAYPYVFIPPYNLMNNDTILALRENDIQYISGSLKHDPPPYDFHSAAPYHFPMTVPTSYIFFNRYWLKLKNNKIMANIHTSIMKYGFAVVLIHPQQYVKMGYGHQSLLNKNLTNLIQRVRYDGLDIITIDEMKRYIDSKFNPNQN